MSTRDAPAVHEGHVPVPGASLYLRDVGEGTPLVVLHGGPDFNHAYLLPDLDALASDFRLIYYDQRGRGKSSAGVAPQDVGIASEVDDLERLRAHLGFGRFALLGHSWGCVLAMEYAARHARRVSHLILLNAAPASHEDLLRFRAQRQAVQAHDLAKMQAIAATTAYARGDIDAEAEYYRLHFARALQRAGDVDIVVRRVRSHFTPDDIVKARAIEERLYDETWRRPDYDVVARLRASRVRTLLVHGERDLVPVECARRIADGLPDATCVVLDRCGHFSYLERPGEVKAAVTRFVGVTAPAGTPPGPPSPVP